MKKARVTLREEYYHSTLSEFWRQEYLGQRFYAGLCEPYPYEPTLDLFAISFTEEKGEGLITLTCFEPGDTIFKFYGTPRHSQTLYTLQKSPGLYVEDPLVMGKVLHSCNPNMSCDMTTQTFTAITRIRSGQFLTMDYESTEDLLFRAFKCECGSAHCRGTISGKKSKSVPSIRL